jgi:hypothetical protein
MYSQLDLLPKVEVDGVEYRDRLHNFAQVFEASISNVLTPKKKRNIITYFKLD